MARGCKVTCKRNLAVLLQFCSYFFQNNDDAKVILANAVQHVGQSVKVWLAAADLEHDMKAKKRVIRKGAVPLSFARTCVILIGYYDSTRGHSQFHPIVERGCQSRG